MKLYIIFLALAVIVEIVGNIPPYSGMLFVGGVTISMFCTTVAAGFVVFAFLSVRETDIKTRGKRKIR